MAARDNITPDLIRKLLDYDPDTGVLTWRPRTPDMFTDGYHKAQSRCSRWNTRYAGQKLKNKDDKGYISTRVLGVSITGHRIAWMHATGSSPREHLDHINGNRADNRFANLRLATRTENNRNSKKSSNNTSGFKGVVYNKKLKKFAAAIGFGGKRLHLGVFVTAEDAHNAYCEAANRLHGAFARTE